MKTKKINHPLMLNNINDSDIKCLINFIKKKPIFTNHKKVIEFEQKWSKWLGTKYSLFVNSGSSANLISIAYLKEIFPKGGEIIVPTLTWSSDVASILHKNFTPIFIDINLNNLAMKIDEVKRKINKNTRAVFLTHILGLNGITDELIKICKKKKIFLIEDCCESHGANFKNKKIGSFGDISNFSFYFAHHMTTIEGGMISTNSKQIYEISRMIRSHGLVRELTDKKLKNFYFKKYPDLNKQFIFGVTGYNLRSTEVNAVLGLNQIKRLDQNIKKRNENFKYFLSKIDSRKYFTKFNLEGQSNYAFIIIFNKKYQNKKFRKKFELILSKNNIEFRRGTSGGGNQMRQPFVRNALKLKEKDFKKYPNIEIIHNFGYYIGNYPELSKKKIDQICNVINNI